MLRQTSCILLKFTRHTRPLSPPISNIHRSKINISSAAMKYINYQLQQRVIDLCEENKLDQARKLINQFIQKGIIHKSTTLCILIRAYILNGQFDEAEEIFKNIQLPSIKLSKRKLLKYCYDSLNHKEFHEVKNFMKYFSKFKKNDLLENIYHKVLEKSLYTGRVEEAFVVINEMKKCNYSFDVIQVANAIRYFIDRDKEKSRQILEKIKSHSFYPSEYIYLIILYKNIKGKLIDISENEKFLKFSKAFSKIADDQMVEKILSYPNKEDQIMFHQELLLRIFASINQMDKVEQIANLIEKNGKLSDVQYAFIIEGYLRIQNFEKATDWHSKMMNLNGKIISYLPIIMTCRGFVKYNLFEEAFTLIERYIKDLGSMNINLSTFGHLIQVFKESNEHLIKLVKILHNANQMSPYHWFTMVKKIWNEEDISNPLQFLLKLNEFGVQPSSFAFDIMLITYARMEMVEQMELVLHSYPKHNFIPGIRALNRALELYSSTNMEKAEILFSLLEENECADEDSFNIILLGYAERKNREKVSEIREKMWKNNIRMKKNVKLKLKDLLKFKE